MFSRLNQRAAHHASSSATGFVTLVGTQTYMDGTPWRINGGSTNGNPGGGQTPSGNIALAVDLGVNMIRLTDFLPSSGTLGVTEYAENYWSGVDSMIARAQYNNLKIYLDLATYRNYLENQSGSFNPYTYDWTAFLTFVANRLNTLTGVRYGDDPTIAFVSFAGETEAPDHSYSITRGVTKQNLIDFYNAVMTKWGTLGRQIRVPGGLFFLTDSTMPWREVFALSSCDLPAIHSYSTDDESMQPTVHSYCQSIGKPWLLEEFGFGAGNYASDLDRATDFNRQYNLALSNGAVGVSWWNIDTGSIVQSSAPLTYAAIQARNSGTATRRTIAPAAPAQGYQYYRFAPSAIRTPSVTLLQISEFELLRSNSTVWGGASASATNNAGNSYEGPDKAADGDTNSKWLTNNGIASTLIYDFGLPIVATGYRLATANDQPDRDPVSWTIAGSKDDTSWTVLDTQTNYPTTTSRNTYLADFTL